LLPLEFCCITDGVPDDGSSATTGDSPNVPFGPLAIMRSTSSFVLGHPFFDLTSPPWPLLDTDGLALLSSAPKSSLMGIKPENWSPNRSSRLVLELSFAADDGPGILTSPSHPPNEANALMDCIGSRYDVNMGLEDTVVNGPGEPKKANVSASGVDVDAFMLGVDPEVEVAGVSDFGIEKPSNCSKMEFGESCVEVEATEDEPLPATRLGPAVLLAKRLSESDGERDVPLLSPVGAGLDGGTENVKDDCFNTTFSFCRRLNMSRKFSFSEAWDSVLASNWATLSSSYSTYQQ
jgi:hypothetical protein